MEKCDAQKWLDRNAKRVIRKMGVPHWTVHFYWELKDSEEWAGRIEMNFKYEEASVQINLPKIDNKKVLEKVITHELAHIAHAPFAILWDAIEPFLPDDKTRDSMLAMYSHAKELTVLNIERIEGVQNA
jgi:hypothetical protein